MLAMRALRFCALWTLVTFASLLSSAQTPAAAIEIPPVDPRVQIFGQYDSSGKDGPRFGYPGSGFLVRFNGNSIEADISSDSGSSALTLVLDHGTPGLSVLKQGLNAVVLASPNTIGPHLIEVYKRTETWQGVVTLTRLRLPRGGELLESPPLPRRKLMFIGDSVTCGAGIDNKAECKTDPERPANDAYDAYGMLLGRKLDAQSRLVCYGGRGLERDYRGLGVADGVVNAPQFYRLAIASDAVSGRVPWDPYRWQPDAVVISLGTNDFNLQKTKPLDRKKWVGEYVAFVRALRKDYRHSYILLTEGAIVTDPLLRQMVQETVAKTHDKKVTYVAAQHYLGLACDAHPTRIEHLYIADDLEPVIRETLGW